MQINEKFRLDKRDNYNLPKSEGANALRCFTEKETTIIDAFRHFKII